jgi:uncharacterized tellurite resistance protein B-like protein
MSHTPLAEYDESERTGYLMVVAYMAHVDGELTSEEVYALREMCFDFVLGPTARGKVMSASVMPREDLEKIISQLATSKLKYSLLADLYAVARADGALHDAEEKEIQELARLLQVEGAHLDGVRKFSEQVHSGGKISEALDALEAGGVPRDALALSNSVWKSQRGASVPA